MLLVPGLGRQSLMVRAHLISMQLIQYTSIAGAASWEYLYFLQASDRLRHGPSDMKISSRFFDIGEGVGAVLLWLHSHELYWGMLWP